MTHKTATAFLLNWDRKSRKWRILLIDHRKIKKLIPIGGHMELNESPEVAVKREVLEETKSSIRLFWDNQRMKWVKESILFSIQIEQIPSFKKIPAHFHEDHMYVGYLPEESLNKIRTGKKTGLHWLYIDDVLAKPQKYNISLETIRTLPKLNIISPPKL